MFLPSIPRTVSSQSCFDAHLLKVLTEDWEELCPLYDSNNPDKAFASLTADEAY